MSPKQGIHRLLSLKGELEADHSIVAVPLFEVLDNGFFGFRKAILDDFGRFIVNDIALCVAVIFDETLFCSFAKFLEREVRACFVIEFVEFVDYLFGSTKVSGQDD